MILGFLISVTQQKTLLKSSCVICHLINQEPALWYWGWGKLQYDVMKEKDLKPNKPELWPIFTTFYLCDFVLIT